MPKRYWTHRGRGRRPGSRGSDKSIRTLEYLALIAVKYNIEAKEFLEYIKESLDKGESEQKQINVKCRQKNKDSAILLLTVGSDFVAQFPISTRIFQNEKQLESYINTIKARKELNRKISNPKIEDLKDGVKYQSLKVKVIEIPEPNIAYTRLGTQAHVSNILVGDETGTIRMSLWNKQINMVSEGDMIEIKNGTVSSFRGQLQLRIGRRGKLKVIQ